MTKKHLILLLFMSFSLACFSQSTATNTVIKNGVGLGSVIAVVASWDRNKSILWAIIHGIFGWLYVLYFALTRD